MYMDGRALRGHGGGHGQLLGPGGGHGGAPCREPGLQHQADDNYTGSAVSLPFWRAKVHMSSLAYSQLNKEGAVDDFPLEERVAFAHSVNLKSRNFFCILAFTAKLFLNEEPLM